MKQFLYSMSFVLLLSCSAPEEASSGFVENEVIAGVLMKVNENKSADEIADFSVFYTNIVEEKEPNSYGWAFFQKGDNIMLLERYKDEAAHLNHITNISPEGILEEEFGQFLEHFEIIEIDIYGNVSDEHKSVINGFGFPTFYNSSIAKFSRN